MSKPVKKNTMPKAPWPHNRLMAVPYLFWSAAFIIIPLCMIFYYGLTDRSGAFTFENVAAISSPEHMKALLTALVLSLISTVVCLALAYPLAMILAGRHVSQQSFIVLIFILPMWMNFLLRTYAWMGLLSVNGPVNAILGFFGLGPYNMLNTSGAVVLGMVYNYVPYMILPLYTSMTKIDQSLVEAAQDLGANTTKTLLRVLIPMSVPGISTGITMVFVPAVSTFVISRMLGGGSNLLIGDLIEMQFLGNSYNLNVGSAMSLVLMIIVLLCMSFTSSFDEDEMEGVS